MAGEAQTGRATPEPKPGREPSGSERAAERRARGRPGAPSRSQAGAPREQRGGFRRFVHESVAELRKVEWPNQKQLLSATVAVIIACVVVGTFLFVCDEAFRRLVQNVLLAG